MKRIFKFFKLSLVLLVLIICATTTLLILFCNTTALKPVIVSQVMKYTDQKITIDGDMHWSFFPTLAINISHLTVDDIHHTHYNIEMSDVRIGVKVLPMLMNKLEAANMDAVIDVQPMDSTAVTHMRLSTGVAVNFYNHKVTFPEMNLAVRTQMGRRMLNMEITGDVVADMKHESLHAEAINCQSDYFSLNGQMDVDHFWHDPFMQGNLNVEVGDMKELMQAMGQKWNGLQEMNGLNGDVIFTYSKKLLNANGEVTVENLQALNLVASDVNAHIFVRNGVINLTNILSSKTYGGSFQGQGSINFTANEPRINLQGKFSNIDAGALWADFLGGENKINLSGQGTIDFSMSTSGSTSRQLLKNLNGNSEINLHDGFVTGIDLAYWINHAYVSVKNQPVAADRVKFSTLTGTIKIKNGILSNNDLLLEMPEIKAKGKGKVDLAQQSVEYVLHTTVKNVILEKVGNMRFSLQDFVPIHIKGNLTDPTVYVDRDNG